MIMDIPEIELDWKRARVARLAQAIIDEPSHKKIGAWAEELSRHAVEIAEANHNTELNAGLREAILGRSNNAGIANGL